MARRINAELTREMLEEMGIKEVVWNDLTNEWNIWRVWYVNKSKKLTRYYRVTITEAKRTHRYVPTTIYPKVSFGYKNKNISIPLGRFIYAWFNGKVREGYEIDHKNNNKWDCTLDNLQELTPTENKRKRYLDNPNGCHNQFDSMKEDDKFGYERRRFWKKKIKELNAIGRK